jgi:hypothetical protein
MQILPQLAVDEGSWHDAEASFSERVFGGMRR